MAQGGVAILPGASADVCSPTRAFHVMGRLQTTGKQVLASMKQGISAAQKKKPPEGGFLVNHDLRGGRVMARGEGVILQKMPILVCSPAQALDVNASLPSADNRGHPGDFYFPFLFCLARNRSS